MEQDYLLLYKTLFDHYGPQNWWPADTPLEMMIGAILVQNTNWRNVEKALIKLRPYLGAEALDRLQEEELAQLIKPSGFFNIKAKRIKSFIQWWKQYNFSLNRVKKLEKETLRKELLNVHGIGRETADVMLLYALDKAVFVVDAYARRIFYRIGYDMPNSYDHFRLEVEQTFPEKLDVFNEFHALLVEHAKQYCRTRPLCNKCPLSSICKKRVE